KRGKLSHENANCALSGLFHGCYDSSSFLHLFFFFFFFSFPGEFSIKKKKKNGKGK
ncbi:hypothetical protein N302_04503, partial [Corvus brachyrhynchos]